MSKTKVIRKCDKCGKLDSIDCYSGLCPDCENKEIFKHLQRENNNLRMDLAVLMSDFKPKKQDKILKIVNELINIEVEQEKLCNQ